jgi:hypothetical protein
MVGITVLLIVNIITLFARELSNQFGVRHLRVGHVTDFHLGYESGNDVGSYYLQAGPSVFAPDGGKE